MRLFLAKCFQTYVRLPNHPAKRRLESWLACLIFPEAGLPFRLKNGLLFHLHPKDWIEYLMIRDGVYEPLTLEFIRRNLNPGQAAIFAGLGSGLHLLEASRHLKGEGDLLGVEPWAGNVVAAQRNAAINLLNKGFSLWIGGLGSSTGILALELPPPENSGMASIASSRELGKINVSLERVDKLAERWGHVRPRLFQLDVEGYESEVLTGCGSAFRPELMIVELLESPPEKLEAIVSQLGSMGYDLFDLRGNKFTLAGDLPERNVVAVSREAKVVWVGA